MIKKLVCMAGVWSLLVCSAVAQEGATESEEPTRNELARRAYAEGSEHFNAERYEEALAAFQRSYDFERLPALLFNMASALDRLGRPEQAIARYEAYLAAMEEDANAPYVRSRIRLLQAELSEQSRDTQAMNEAAPEESSEPPGAEPEPLPAAEEPSRTGPIVLFALGGAALAAALGTGLRARALDSDVRDRCTGVCPADSEADAARVTRLARTTDAMAGVAGAAVLGGVLWWVLSSGDEDAPQASASCNTNSCRADLRLAF